MNKEYSDAFGFRKLGHFTAFMTQFTDKGGQIQSICDEDFKATCIKCYPIILSTGIDPSKYNPPTTAGASSIRATLREMFSVGVVDLETESEDEETLQTDLSPRKPLKKSPEPKKKELLKTVDVSCLKCSLLSTSNKNLLRDLEISTQNEQKLIVENKNLRKALAEKSLELKNVKEDYKNLFNETSNIRENPAYQDILKFFEYNKRKRT